MVVHVAPCRSDVPRCRANGPRCRRKCSAMSHDDAPCRILQVQTRNSKLTSAWPPTRYEFPMIPGRQNISPFFSSSLLTCNLRLATCDLPPLEGRGKRFRGVVRKISEGSPLAGRKPRRKSPRFFILRFGVANSGVNRSGFRTPFGSSVAL